MRFFRPRGRPKSVGDDVLDTGESETDGGYDSPSMFLQAFPSSRLPHPRAHEAPLVIIQAGLSSQIPNPQFVESTHHAHLNVMLENVHLPRVRPLELSGTVLVRNIAFGKDVCVRYSLDDWHTTSEVKAAYRGSLPFLPAPFKSGRDSPQASQAQGRTWDRFGFKVSIDDLQLRPGERTVWLAIRYNVAGGEYWDNNLGANYKIVLVPEERAATAPSASVSAATSHSRFAHNTLPRRAAVSSPGAMSGPRSSPPWTTSFPTMSAQSVAQSTRPVLPPAYNPGVSAGLSSMPWTYDLPAHPTANPGEYS